MKIYPSIPDFKSSEKTIITLGTFDGVHVGHKKIIARLVHSAAETQSKSLILTFFPHPRMVLQDNSEIKLLNTMDEKAALLAKVGLDILVIHPFDKDFSRLTAEDFVKTILVDQLNIKKIIIGHDHRFGRNRTANIDDLIVFGEKYDFEVEQISAEEINEVAVSSTKIRHALSEGNMALANEYLGYEYFLTGTVVKGKQLGRTIGFPTANLDIHESYKLIPKNGVYSIKSIIDGCTVFGMMNIGTNPTVNGQNRSIEVHLFDFNADLYDHKIEVFMAHYIREEKKFNSVEALRLQLEKDQKTALSLIHNQ